MRSMLDHNLGKLMLLAVPEDATTNSQSGFVSKVLVPRPRRFSYIVKIREVTTEDDGQVYLHPEPLATGLIMRDCMFRLDASIRLWSQTAQMTSNNPRNSSTHEDHKREFGPGPSRFRAMRLIICAIIPTFRHQCFYRAGS
jgi:hypothetical protein